MRSTSRFVVAVALVAMSSCGGGGTNGPDGVPTSTPPPTALKACVKTSPDPVKVGETLTVDATCSTPASGLTYSWDPGDGRPAKTGGATMTDSYAKSGRYTASLTVSNGGASDKMSATVRVHIECQQPASNGPNVISVDQNRLCLISGDAGGTLQVTSNGTVLFKNSDFRLEGAAFEVKTNECLDKGLSGTTLFPTDKCDIKITGTCSEGTTGRFSIGGPGGSVPSRYNVNLTCNP
jgi:hypothetical protein